MSKKFVSASKETKPDAVYNSKLVTKFINCMMWQGKKSTSQQIFYGAMEVISKQLKDKAPLEVFEKAMDNVKPMIEVRSKRVGGASYQVPMQVNSKRQQSLAIRWLLEASRSRKGKPMHERLALELMEAFEGRGGAMTVRENIHKMAEANKAFAHFAW
jgi:small subunit ribosomal protein S7